MSSTGCHSSPIGPATPSTGMTWRTVESRTPSVERDGPGRSGPAWTTKSGPNRRSSACGTGATGRDHCNASGHSGLCCRASLGSPFLLVCFLGLMFQCFLHSLHGEGLPFQVRFAKGFFRIEFRQVPKQNSRLPSSVANQLPSRREPSWLPGSKVAVHSTAVRAPARCLAEVSPASYLASHMTADSEPGSPP